MSEEKYALPLPLCITEETDELKYANTFSILFAPKCFEKMGLYILCMQKHLSAQYAKGSPQVWMLRQLSVIAKGDQCIMKELCQDTKHGQSRHFDQYSIY
ncbi:hypothetical protein AMECASPLE_031539 [Ameca splendens]|uniref:Uncharacterized protein n=1 Tax=Ameca splendens TaxID=208324 RepID=A0ABV0YTD1_9TELE